MSLFIILSSIVLLLWIVLFFGKDDREPANFVLYEWDKENNRGYAVVAVEFNFEIAWDDVFNKPDYLVEYEWLDIYHSYTMVERESGIKNDYHLLGFTTESIMKRDWDTEKMLKEANLLRERIIATPQ